MIARYDQTSGHIAYLGSGFIVLGGLTKAVWKLVIAATGNNLAGLDDLLFVFLGPGFTLLAWGLWKAQLLMGNKPVPQKIWYRPIGIIALVGLGAISARILAPQARYWVYILLTLTTVANLAAGILLIRQAKWQQLSITTGLFLFNLIAIFVLSGLARVPEQTIALQWIEESINVLAQGAFGFAAWQLSQETAVVAAEKITA
jgi:hypothetical protein